MIYELKGDLLESDCNVLIHSCNCFHTMGAGIAKTISARYPMALIADKQTRYGDRKKLGSFSAAQAPDGRLIYNLYGQYRYGRGRRQVDYAALEMGLERIKKDMEFYAAFYKAGTCRMGCGLAGGDWAIVSGIINKVFPYTDIHVYVW